MSMAQQLLSEFRIGPMSVRNRIVFTAPAPAYAGLDENANRPTPELAAYWEYMARGGVGLLITEPQSVHPTSTSNPRTVENVSDDLVPLYRSVADSVHDGGGKIVGHLWHAGFLAATGYRNLPLWAPSAVRAPMGAMVPMGGGAVAYAMGRSEIRGIIESFASAAARLRQATFDGVEVNAASGFLLAEFLSPKVNLRTDDYGGSLENRCRIVVEILRAVRQAVGPGLAVGVRLSADPYIEPGLTDSDLTELAGHLSQAVPIDYINLMPALLPDASFPQGTGSDVTLAVRRAAGVPVIYNGSLTDPGVAEKMVAEGGIELVGMTRAILADPQLPSKLQGGQRDQIRLCIACNQTCSGGAGGMAALGTPSCLLNPLPAEVDRLARTRDGEGQKLLVIGAGLAGLEVARLARLRGYSVTVWERDDDIGGQVRLVASVPQRAPFREAIEFYRRQLSTLGVELHFGRQATVEAVEAFNPDVVVVATGSRAANPSWFHSSNGETSAASVTDVRAVLANRVQVGKRVVISMAEVDHGYQALPVAEMLADRGHEVTIVSPAFEPCINQDFSTSENAYRRLLRKGIRFITTTEVIAARPGEVEIRNVYTRRTETLPADSVIASHGGVADDSLIDQLQERRTNVFAAGDCVAPRDIAGAISDGVRLMEKLPVVVRR
jgi:2,4-dienoyl-CoA reductase-like NADH-dependent reductase (Old Yellow Enzyme family)